MRWIVLRLCYNSNWWPAATTTTTDVDFWNYGYEPLPTGENKTPSAATVYTFGLPPALWFLPR